DTSCNATSASLVGATPSTQAETCQIQPFFNDIWFSFTANQPKQIIDLSNIVDRPQQLIGQISSGQCGTLIQHSCFDIPDSENNPVHVLENLVPGTSYFLRMASYDISALSTTFDICIRDTVPDPPANDECATAVAITVSTGATCTSTVSGTLLGATSSGAASSCPSGGSFDDDVWFSFVATETTHEIILKNISGSTLDLDVQVSSGSCGALAQITCHRAPTPDDSTGFALSGLTMGNTYYIRVATFPNDLQTTTFDICVRTPVELCSLLVTNTNNSGPGSLRFAIECSETGDTIRFDATVFNMTIAIDTPGIIVPHQLLLESQFDDNITISNVDINNSDVLVNIQGDLTLWGLRLTGLSAESLIIKVEPTGSINLIDCQLNRVTLDN
ncbi:MAG: hypothetical protein OEQ53_10070, partial [Saprospiraceae bacterium]|nr:hypothetical protein [Saprospiraceae bacterium]